MVLCTSDDDPRESWMPLRTESRLGSGDRNGSWLKPFLEKPAEAGSASHVTQIPGPEGPLYYASRHAAKADSWIGLTVVNSSVQAMYPETGKSFLLERDGTAGGPLT